jgi:hypothetical protein
MSVSLVEGVWRVIDADRATTIHGRDPHREADRAVAQLLDAGDCDLLVVIGLGLGFLLDALERRHWGGRILAIEPEPQTVPELRARRDWSAWTNADRLRILVGPAFEGATDCWRWLGDGSDEPRLFVHPVLERIRPNEVAAARAVVQRIRYDAVSNAEARRKFGANYLLNTLTNLPAIASQPDVSVLRGSASGVPAIVVGAGPSLDSSLAALLEVQHKALIICVDTALRPLLAGGVHPHAVVALDPTELNGQHLTEVPECKNTFLVSEGSIEPLAVTAFAGRTFFFSVSDHQPWPWLQGLGTGAGQLRAWGSVLTGAFDLALTMGTDPIVFVGADLSYPGDRPYCRRVSFEEEWARRERSGTPLEQQWQDAIDHWGRQMEPDVTGVPVRTAPHLVAFRDWLLQQMRQHSSRRFVNAGGAGILKGANIEQRLPGDLSSLFAGHGVLAHPFRERHRSRDSQRVRAAARALAQDAASGGASNAVLRDWQAFAPGITLEAIAQALGAAERGFAGVPDRSPKSGADATAPERAIIEVTTDAVRKLGDVIPLVPMVIPAHRLDLTSSGARMFRFRTTASAIICSAMRAWQDGVAEDGVPLTRVFDTDDVLPGTYAAFADVILFRATDGSDPRRNGRRYTVLVPEPVVYLESLPLLEVVARRI